ncbi:MAG: hypothetical protein IKP22_09380 [Clostridia bacterium]|nr:hypothetical protein [Clostridia bacterium]
MTDSSNTRPEPSWKAGDDWTLFPFWFWNDTLEEEKLLSQVRDMYAHGIRGFVIHPRKGLTEDTPYLGEAFMRHVRAVCLEAGRLDMKVILYDEGMYPSGSAHGEVVREDPSWASKCLVREPLDAPGMPGGVEIARFRPDGKGWKLLAPGENAPGAVRLSLCFSGGTIRGLYPGEDDGEKNAPSSADLLCPEAVDSFIRHTHEKYYAALGDLFGDTVVAMFTDEPMITGRRGLPGGIPWTEGFEKECLAAGLGLKDLPLLFDPETDSNRHVLRLYRRTVNERLNRVFYGKLALWCSSHGTALTGHPAQSWDMSLEKHFAWPGQDLVWNMITPDSEDGILKKDSVLAACAADSALHAGKTRVMCEAFGCCGPAESPWAFTFDRMKWYTDHLLVRGVNTLVPHAFFYSLREERGQERPPDLGMNSLFWPWYSKYAAYVARLSGMNGEGLRRADTAVVCAGDDMPAAACAPLYRAQVPFHYLDQALLGAAEIENGRLKVGNGNYLRAVVPDESVLSPEAKAVLTRFASSGGAVTPCISDALPFPAVTVTPPAPFLRVSPVLWRGKTHYILSNEGEEEIRGTLHVPGTDANASFTGMDPWSGCVFPLKRGPVRLRLGRRETVVLREGPCEGSERDELAPVESLPALTDFRPVKANWLCVPEGFPSFQLTPSPDGALPLLPAGREDLRLFSGTVKYSCVITSGRPSAHPALDLGRVRETAEVFVNGRPAGVRLWGPFRFDLTGLLKEGENTLEILVTNTPAPKMDGVSLPFGLAGPVTAQGL